MKKILAFNGSIRKSGNTAHLLNNFLDGCKEGNNQVNEYQADELNLDYCTGCLRCNIIRRCSIRGDAWEDISKKILDSDVLVFASPIYFHHVSAQMKKIIDRFRSFVHVQITEDGLTHTPHQQWNKDFVLLLSMGSPDEIDAQPVVDLFKYITEILGEGNRLHVIKGTRLAVANHAVKTEEELKILYKKMSLPKELALPDYKKNQDILKSCRNLGRQIANS